MKGTETLSFLLRTFYKDGDRQSELDRQLIEADVQRWISVWGQPGN